MNEQDAKYMAALEKFEKAAIELSEAFNRLSPQFQDDVDEIYPFNKDFEEMMHEIIIWRDELKSRQGEKSVHEKTE